jgi:hypothetical protein
MKQTKSSKTSVVVIDSVIHSYIKELALADKRTLKAWLEIHFSNLYVNKVNTNVYKPPIDVIKVEPELDTDMYIDSIDTPNPMDVLLEDWRD